MIEMTNDMPMPTSRNFAAWSAVGAVLYILVVWVATARLHQDVMGAILQPTKVTAELGLCLILSMAVTGFANRKRPISLRTLRNFLIQNAVAIGAFLLTIWGFSALARTSTVSISGWAAAIMGATFVVLAVLGSLATASAHTGLDLIDDEMAAEELRERGRSFLYSFIWMAACGLLLIGLSLAGPGGLLPPPIALAGALVLIVVLVVLGIAARRLSDELARTLSRETGNIAFHLILVLGGGWAMLAHLGFVPAPAPLDWLTMFIVLMFVAAFIAVGRRKLFAR
jgi:uncharacterized membrane protein